MSILNTILNLFRPDTSFGARRDKDWRRESKAFKKGKVCAMTGTKKKLQVHHVFPVWLFPEKEMDKRYWIVLSGKKLYGVVPHLFLAHLGNYRRYNPNIVKDAAKWYNILKGRESNNKIN